MPPHTYHGYAQLEDLPDHTRCAPYTASFTSAREENWHLTTPPDPQFLVAYADGSWHPTRRRGGWAIWARDKTLRVIKSSRCQDWVRHSHHAEGQAFVEAVFAAFECLDYATADILVVKTDCQSLVDLLTGSRGARVRVRDQELRTQLMIAFRAATLANVRIMPKWVRSHQKGLGAEARLNRLADRYARIACHKNRRILRIDRI